MMKKTLAVLIALFLLIACAPSVFAFRTNTTRALFYIQRFGVQMDSEGQIGTRDSAYFTPQLYEGRLSNKKRDDGYTVIYKDGSVSSDDVISEVLVKPNDEDIIESVKKVYTKKGGYVLSSNGKVVDWDNFDTNRYEIRWYILKYEKNDFPAAWHIDGVIVEKETQKPIEIPSPEDPGYIPPEELPKEEDKDPDDVDPEDLIPDITSKHAYIYGYNDNVMAAENELQRGEVCAMVHRLAKQNDVLDGYSFDESADPIYPDTADEWFRSGIEFARYKGGLETADGENVCPYANVTRGEAFRIVCLAFDFTKDTDLSYENYAKILSDGGFVLGDENGDLNIEGLITRAQFCTIYNRIIGRENAKLVTADGTKITADTYGFTDLNEDDWYYEIILRATSAYDDEGYVSVDLRNRRNVLDDYQ